MTMHIRASSLGELMDCSLRWYYRNIMGIRAPASGAMHLGTSLHRSSAAFDSANVDESPISIDDAAEVFVDALHHPAEEVSWAGDSIQTAERVGLKLTALYCRSEPRYIVVEGERLSLDVDTNAGPITLTGTPDRVRRVCGGVGITDLKTGTRAVTTSGLAVTAGHALQMGAYELLVEESLDQRIDAPAEIVGLQTSATPRMGVGSIDSPKSLLLPDKEGGGILAIAAQMIHSGLFPPNPRSIVCGPKYCPAHRLAGGPCRYA